MKKPKILFVTEKWAECDPSHELSVGRYNFIGSLEAAGLADFSIFHFDETVLRTGETCDQPLIEICKAERPDLIFLTMVKGTDVNPLPNTLAQIRNELGIKVASLYGDSFDQTAIDWIETYSHAVDANIVQDCYSFYQSRVEDTSKYLPTWTPQDPRIFFAATTPPFRDITFVGSVLRYPSRKLALGMLAEIGIDVAQGGGQNEDNLDIETYAASLRESKIALNFSQPVFDEPVRQCKGRTMEITLSGALLMEQRNFETERWLIPGEDYVDWEYESELIDKTRYFLDHNLERQKIAEAGCIKAHTLYSADAYWRLIFASLLPEFENS
jgi:hypothetical protein